MKIQMRCFQRLHLSENHCCKREVCGFVSPFAIYTLHPLILGLVNICQSWLLDEAISGLKSSWHSFSGFLVMSICCEVAISSLRHSKITRDLPYAVKSSNPRQSSNQLTNWCHVCQSYFRASISDNPSCRCWCERQHMDPLIIRCLGIDRTTSAQVVTTQQVKSLKSDLLLLPRAFQFPYAFSSKEMGLKK